MHTAHLSFFTRPTELFLGFMGGYSLNSRGRKFYTYRKEASSTHSLKSFMEILGDGEGNKFSDTISEKLLTLFNFTLFTIFTLYTLFITDGLKKAQRGKLSKWKVHIFHWFGNSEILFYFRSRYSLN